MPRGFGYRKAAFPLRVTRDHVPYDQWQAQGFLKTTEGNVVHYAHIEAFIEELGTRFTIREIAYDRWGAVQKSQNLQDDPLRQELAIVFIIAGLNVERDQVTTRQTELEAVVTAMTTHDQQIARNQDDQARRIKHVKDEYNRDGEQLNTIEHKSWNEPSNTARYFPPTNPSNETLHPNPMDRAH